jgi:hypothetical protein
MTRTLAMAGMIQNGNAGTPCSASFMINREITHRTLLANFWLPLLFFALVSLLMIGPYVIPPTRITTFGNAPQDSFIFLWGLWWTKQAVFELSNPYWTDLLFYPAGTTLTFHTYPLFYGLLSLPFQLLMNGISGLVVALNVIIYLSFVLSGFGAYRLAVHVTRSRPAGLVAGLTYAFVPFHLMNMVSLNLLAMEFLPFYVLSLLKLREKPAFRSALAVALWLALTYYSSLEYALFLLWVIWGLQRYFSFCSPPRSSISRSGYILLSRPLWPWTLGKSRCGALRCSPFSPPPAFIPFTARLFLWVER